MECVLLIQPVVYHTKYGTISPWDIPSLGLAYLAAVLERAHYKVEIIDAHIEQLSFKGLKERIQKINPKIIGITANGFSAQYAILTSRFVKKAFPQSILVMGGPFPTMQYQDLLQKNVCDVCVIGEGEYTFLEFVEKVFKEQQYDNVKGLAFRSHFKKEEIMVTPPRELIQKLDELPFPAWHLFPSLKKYKNLRGVTKRPFVPIMTSRGCPYGCNWCTKCVHGRGFRARSPENVVQEIDYLIKNFGVKELAFMDDAFSFKLDRVKKICYLIRKNNLDIYFNLYHGLRADSITPSLIKYLTAVGTNRITMGVESGNQQVVLKVGKELDLKKVLEAIHICKQNKLILDGYFILGHPYDTIQTMEQTIRFAIKADFDHAYFFIATPFPGTELYNIVQKECKLLTEVNFGSKSHIVEGKAIFETQNFRAKDVENYFMQAYKRFYFRPIKILHLINVYGRLLLQYHATQEIFWLCTQALLLLKLLFRRNPKSEK